MKSVMTKDFSRVAQTEISRSTFDRSHGLKTAFDSGYLIPVELQEVVPSDTVDFDGKFLARLAPVVTPVMDRVVMDLHAFFIPSRLIWNNFTKMMGERVNPNDSIDYVIPTIKMTYGDDFGVGSLADYLGLPVNQLTATSGGTDVSVLPFRAYQKVWDDWYRDENLQNSVIRSSSELGDQTSDISKWVKLRKRGKRHDYYTSALPFPQKGEGVNLPLGGLAPVITSTNQVPPGTRSDMYLRWYNVADNTAYKSPSGEKSYIGLSSGGNATSAFSAGNGEEDARLAPMNLFADLSDATAATINSLRMAFQLQRMMESDARGGTRYVEIIRNHFKTICPDARLQRSEYLGGASLPITFSPIAQTSSTADGSTPQGNLAATAHVFGDLKFTRSFSEHGYLLILASVRCDLNYQQGVDRLWTRSNRYDFYWPTLAHLGEQVVENKEIFLSGDNTVDSQGNKVDEGVFGYQERYAELRYNPSRITGKMRSGVSGSLDVWHLAQNFEDLPVLSSVFIEEDPPLDRVLAVAEGEPQIIMECYLGQKWTRPLPVYSIPGLIDHL